MRRSWQRWSATPAELRKHELPDWAPRTRAKLADIVNADSDAKRKTALEALERDATIAGPKLANDAWRARRRFDIASTNGLTLSVVVGIMVLIAGIRIRRRARKHTPTAPRGG